MRLVHGIISRITGPAGCEAVDARGEAQDAARLGFANTHGEVDERSRMGKFAKNNKEDDEAWNPAVELVVVDDFVAEEGDKEGGSRNDNDAGITGDIMVDGVQELSTDDDVHGGPANASEDVEDGN